MEMPRILAISMKAILRHFSIFLSAVLFPFVFTHIATAETHPDEILGSGYEELQKSVQEGITDPVAHVAIPFPPDDPVYAEKRTQTHVTAGFPSAGCNPVGRPVF